MDSGCFFLLSCVLPYWLCQELVHLSQLQQVVAFQLGNDEMQGGTLRHPMHDWAFGISVDRRTLFFSIYRQIIACL